MTEILRVTNLTKTYTSSYSFFRKRRKGKKVLHSISFSLNEGEILGILGPNGAGKTTLINCLLGLLQPTGGEILYFGKRFQTHRSESLQQVSHASAYAKLCGALTVQENLEIMALLYGFSKKAGRERIDQLLQIFQIEKLRKKQGRTLSAGQMTRVMLAKAFIPRCRLVLLDEPTASLDPDIAALVRQYILKMQQKEKVSIILTSHNMKEVEQICSRILVVKKGEIIEEDTPKMLINKTGTHRLIVSDISSMTKAESILKEYPYRKYEKTFDISIKEEDIAKLLQTFAEEKIHYQQIRVQEPTLEEYFTRLAEEK